MWFTFAVIALLCWSGSDLFSKIGCQDGSDRYSHLIDRARVEASECIANTLLIRKKA